MSLILTRRRIWVELPRSRNPPLRKRSLRDGVLPIHSSHLTAFNKTPSESKQCFLLLLTVGN